MSGFSTHFGVSLNPTVSQAIKQVGWRSSLQELIERCCAIGFANLRAQHAKEMQKWNAELGRLDSDREYKKGNRDYWRQHSRQWIGIFKNKLIQVAAEQKSGTYPRPSTANVSTARRKLGGMYDCRTHRDVPNRNMIEPVRQRRTAQVTY